MVFEAQYGEAAGLDDFLAVLIFVELIVMHGAVEFDDEPLFVAIEVDDVVANDVLSPKTEAGEAVGSECLPEAIFVLGGFVSQFPGAKLEALPCSA